MKKLLLAFLVVFSTFFYAQKLKIVSGNFDFLKDQSEVNVQLTFDNTLYQVENMTEEHYLEKRKSDVLANPKKNQQDWENWLTQWENFKNTEYIQYFIKGVNTNGKAKNLIFSANSSAKYTLIVNAKWIYAGWHGGMIGQEAKLSSELLFVETADPSHVLLQINADEILGKPQNKYFVMEYGRIAGAYEQTGKDLRKEIRKTIK